MKLHHIVIVVIFAAAAGLPGLARADGKFSPIGWGPAHWEGLHEFQPYIENPKQNQNQQWDNDPWTPSAWAQQRADGGKRVVEDLFKADIFRDKTVTHGIPTIEVGPVFYELGGNDQRRVTAMLDDYYGITKNKVYGMYKLTDWNTHQMIGTYTQYGLQME